MSILTCIARVVIFNVLAEYINACILMLLEYELAQVPFLTKAIGVTIVSSLHNIPRFPVRLIMF